MKKIIRSRLPERLAGRIPAWSVELIVGVTVPIVLVALRVPLMSAMADRVPFAFNFVAVILAAVLAGWRSGLLALVFGQLLTWYVIVEPHWSFAVADSERAWALVVATISQAAMLLVIALYQREVDKGVAKRERLLELYEHARREIDHRIWNNYQTVLALVRLQARRSEDPAVKDAPRQVADRIGAIAAATDHLAFRSGDLTTIRIGEHLCGLCEQLQQGLTGDGVTVRCTVADVAVPAVEATYLAIVVNELVTNALKHAFPDGRTGSVWVESNVTDRGLELVVWDDGAGMQAPATSSGSGLGQKLVQAFVKELGGEHEVSTADAGTRHRILVPGLSG